MARNHEAAVRVLYVSLAMGILGDWLFRVTPLGLNASVWFVALVASVVCLIPDRPVPERPVHDGGVPKEPAPEEPVRENESGHGRPLICLGAIALLFAATMAWRDSAVLKAICLLGIFVVLSLACLVASQKSIRETSVWQLGRVMLGTSLGALAGLPPVMASDVDFKPGRAELQQHNMAAIGRGLMISVPILVVFGVLLMSADEAFHRLIASLVDFSLTDLVTHLALVVLFGWIVAGYLRGLIIGKQPLAARAPRQSLSGVDIVEIGLPLALVDILFLLFVIIQFKYFFGGDSHVQSTTRLVYSEYARRGFFELVAVAALVLPMLLICHALLDKSNPDHELVFRLIAGVQVLLLSVIMLSALQRMRLYQQEYGMTELRLYTVAFMVWLGLVFLCFGLTVLRGRTEGFALFSLMAALAIAVALFAVNPDALIVRTNAARAQAGHRFDVDYNSSLSADAIPSLIEAMPHLSEPGRPRLANQLLLESTRLSAGDWRTWSLSRRNAHAAIEANRPQLERWAAELSAAR